MDETQNDKSSDRQPTQLIRKPPYPKRLMLPRIGGQPQFNLLGELKNLYVKIPLLQALQDIPIYARTVLDLCTKKPGRKPIDPPTVHVIGKLSALIIGKTLLAKYDDPRNPTVTVQIGSMQIPNVLVYLGATINVMTIETIRKLRLTNLRPTPTILELADRSTIKPKGILDDLIILVDLWEYPDDFLVLQPKS